MIVFIPVEEVEYLVLDENQVFFLICSFFWFGVGKGLSFLFLGDEKEKQDYYSVLSPP